MTFRKDATLDAPRSPALRYGGHEPGASLSYFTGASVDLVVGALIPIPAEGLTIGRRAAATLRVACGEVGPRHAQLTVTDGGVVLEDLQSANGTSLNGVRVTGPTPVMPNDRITIAGQSHFVLVELG